MTEHERQQARDRAADAYVTRDRVICGPDGWADRITDPMLYVEERRRRADRRRTRTR